MIDYPTTVIMSKLIEHGFTSAPTQYRLYGRRFLQVWWPNQQCRCTEGGWLVIQTGLSLTRLSSPCYNNTTCMSNYVKIATKQLLLPNKPIKISHKDKILTTKVYKNYYSVSYTITNQISKYQLSLRPHRTSRHCFGRWKCLSRYSSRKYTNN